MTLASNLRAPGLFGFAGVNHPCNYGMMIPICKVKPHRLVGPFMQRKAQSAVFRLPDPLGYVASIDRSPNLVG